MPKFLTEIQLATTGSIETPDQRGQNYDVFAIYAGIDGNLYVKDNNGNQKKLNINLEWVKY